MNFRRKGLISFGVIVVFSFAFYGISKTNKEDKIETTHEDIISYNNVLATPPIPKMVQFCGEEVPINIYYVREGLERELIIHCYQHSRTIQTFKRSTRFFPEIEKILKEEGVPEDLKYLCVAESSLENVASPSQAAGFWQFMESTGKNYGLEINDNVDERYHIEKSTRAACTYLKALKEKFGTWALAAAAYNMGENGLQRSISEQSVNNYWDLYLNTETSRYVNRIISYKLMFEEPEKYGVKLKLTECYRPIPYTEIAVDSTIPSLLDFAKANNILYRELKEMNPWLRNKVLPIKEKKYSVRVPVKTKSTYEELY
ncbi:MAG TPA: lytic transglycosylase domain-containing protein [Bacteroidales bacterium]|nr:lytic transglycosylase domain-containing protein [Bacteroidales bacterium]HPS71106.1 lytic transglycosylase domain-containing protein [Bacteroidales bacterium]